MSKEFKCRTVDGPMPGIAIRSVGKGEARNSASVSLPILERLISNPFAALLDVMIGVCFFSDYFFVIYRSSNVQNTCIM